VWLFLYCLGAHRVIENGLDVFILAPALGSCGPEVFRIAEIRMTKGRPDRAFNADPLQTGNREGRCTAEVVAARRHNPFTRSRPKRSP